MTSEEDFHSVLTSASNLELGNQNMILDKECASGREPLCYDEGKLYAW
jgi:hypothetical protein